METEYSRILFIVTLLSMVFSVINCGGGRGGDSSSANAQGQSTENTYTPVCGATAIAGDSDKPQAEIIFPWNNKKTVQDLVLVSGIAFDNSGIALIEVNGVKANIECEVPKHIQLDSSQINSVYWYAHLTFNEGEKNDIDVRVIDGVGNVHDSAVQHQILVVEDIIPTSFVLDSEGQRILADDRFGNIVELNLTSGDRQKLLDNQGKNSASNLILDAHYVYYVKFDRDNKNRIIVYKADTIEKTVQELDRVDVDLSDNMFISSNQLSFDPINKTIYLSLRVDERFPFSQQSYIYKYQISTKTFSLLTSSEKVMHSPGAPNVMVFNGDHLLLINTDFNAGLTRVDVGTGNVTKIWEDIVIDWDKMAIDRDNQVLFVVNSGGVTTVDLTNGETKVISDDATQDQYWFDSVSMAVFDATNQQVLVHDPVQDMVIGVDVNTGKRKPIWQNSFGEGRRLLKLEEMVLDESTQQVIVIDKGVDAQAALFTIDLETGNRTHLSEIPDKPADQFSLVYDRNNERILWNEHNKIIAFNLSTHVISDVSSDMIGTGESLHDSKGMAIDYENNRVFVTDAHLNDIVIVDLDSGNRYLAPKSNLIEDGTELLEPARIAYDDKHQRVYVFDRTHRAIISIDIESGNRQVVSQNCIDEQGNSQLFGHIGNIVYLPNADQLWIVSSSLLVLDINNLECVVVNQSIAGIHDLAVNKKGQIIGINSMELLQLNYRNYEEVLISK